MVYNFPRSVPLRNNLFHHAMESLLLIKLAFVELYDYGAVFSLSILLCICMGYVIKIDCYVFNSAYIVYNERCDCRHFGISPTECRLHCVDYGFG